MPRRSTAARLAPAAVAVALLLTGGTATGVALTGLPAAPGAPTSGLSADVEVRPQPVLPHVPVPAAAARPPSPAKAAPTGAGPAVRPLGALRSPDLLVEVPAGLTDTELRLLDEVPGVQALTALDVGTVDVRGTPRRVAGVDPSAFRAFTPKETAASDALWQAVARGELAPSYGLLRAQNLVLGGRLEVAGTASERIGGVASFGVPDVDLVVSRTVAARLGVRRSTAVLLSAPQRSLPRLRRQVLAVTGRAELTVLRPVAVPSSPRRGRPSTYRELYVDSARYCPGLSWTVLAAIGQVESGHGRNLGPSSAGALGPMQFLPSTWAAYGVDGDADGDADINDPFDAIPAAALYLCRNGANRGPQGLYDAVFAYNHADWYVRQVLALAQAYRAQG